MPPAPTDRYEIRVPPPHPGQERVIRSKVRNRVIRCGRRWGKTVLDEYEVARVLCEAPGRQVGWFTPEWKYLKPAYDDLCRILDPLIVRRNETHFRIELFTGGVFEGWTVNDNPNAGRSRKYHLAVFDECGLIKQFKQLWLASARQTLVDYRGRAVFTGTPDPSATWFNYLFDMGEAGTAGWQSFTGRTVDNRNLPGVDEEAAEARLWMPEWMYLQEFEGIPTETAGGLFSARVIKRHREQYAAEPLWRGDLVIDGVEEDSSEEHKLLQHPERARDRIGFVEDAKRGRWRLWCDLDRSGQPKRGTAYVAGWDWGRGAGASNTIGSTADAYTGQKVAEYATAGRMIHEATRDAIMGAYFFWGLNGPARLNFEKNGPGEEFCRLALRMGFRRLFRERTQGTNPAEQSKKSYGWQSTAQAKETLLLDYAADLAKERFKNPSGPALDECLKYRYNDRNQIEVVESAADEVTEAQVPHGDRPIADALAAKAAKHERVREGAERKAEPGSFAHRQREVEAAEARGRR